MSVPDHVVLHGLRLLDGRFVIRIYGVEDNPKGTLEKGAGFLGTSLPAFLERMVCRRRIYGKTASIFMVRRSLPCGGYDGRGYQVIP